MRLDYTDEDTQRARSSAGQETVHLQGPPALAPAAPVAAPQSRRAGLGALLIGGGALLLLARAVELPVDIVPGMIMLTMASIFLFFGLWQRIYGLIIPGSIIGGLSMGVAFASATEGVSILWGLALGFMAIYGLGRTLYGQRSPWPMIPAGVLFGVGLIVAVATLPSIFGLTLIWIPVALIAAGFYLGFVRPRP